LKRILYILFVIAQGLIYSIGISAQDSIAIKQDKIVPSNALTRISIGGGGFTYDGLDDWFIASSINLSLQKRIHVMSFKYTFAMEALIMGGPPNKLSSFDLTYGLINQGPEIYCSLSTGLNYSLLTDNHPFDGVRILRQRLGVPIDLQLFMIAKKVGAGFDGFVVLHNGFTSYGASVYVQIIIGPCRKKG
jgi:hypothetical protein